MSKKKSLFADAITDAKELKETALANAKLALAESFAPKVQSMISSKLNEMEEELDENYGEEDEKSLDEILQEMEGETEVETDDVDMSFDETEETEEEFETGEEFEEEGTEEEVVDLTVDELKDVIRDVMAELEGGSEEGEMDLDLDTETEEADDIVTFDDEEESDDLNLDEILAEIEQTHQTQPSSHFEQELNEAKQEIAKLKQQLKENNLLLAKSIYLNKILKANTLSESKKVAVINAFDRVSTVKEAKNTFETLKESLSKPTTNILKENKGSASKALGVGKKEILTEQKTDAFIARMQKLAGIN